MAARPSANALPTAPAPSRANRGNAGCGARAAQGRWMAGNARADRNSGRITRPMADIALPDALRSGFSWRYDPPSPFLEISPGPRARGQWQCRSRFAAVDECGSYLIRMGFAALGRPRAPVFACVLSGRGKHVGRSSSVSGLFPARPHLSIRIPEVGQSIRRVRYCGDLIDPYGTAASRECVVSPTELVCGIPVHIGTECYASSNESRVGERTGSCVGIGLGIWPTSGNVGRNPSNRISEAVGIWSALKRKIPDKHAI